MRTGLLIFSMLVMASPVVAQRPVGKGQQKALQGGRTDSGARRALLNERFRERSAKLVQEKLGLNQDQMRKLREVNGPIEARRRALAQQERAARVALRAEVRRGKAADQGRVAQLNSQLREFERARMDLRQDEQRQLATFLTPVQQAQYVALQTQLRKRMQEMLEEQD